ncbi:hypothetical protein [Pseudoponticoccus marisrubri]|uniref:CTP synthetase n=1 Tax=Pseudoponticoccus marisrubri TaxID=1685382 RepID=A0A0W7WHQ1_9RHOB|nr:hypothetical protein [Pseudoponticoccus marisrubri]KUF10105.1 hypothetical protein AVJ23_13705 [Pseudoponticoccus marisrubri]
MDRLSLFLTLMTGSVITGALTIIFFASGWYAWQAIAWAAGIGFLAAWPVARLISRRIKKQDPSFPDRDPGWVPDPKAPEV